MHWWMTSILGLVMTSNGSSLTVLSQKRTAYRYIDNSDNNVLSPLTWDHVPSPQQSYGQTCILHEIQSRNLLLGISYISIHRKAMKQSVVIFHCLLHRKPVTGRKPFANYIEKHENPVAVLIMKSWRQTFEGHCHTTL